MAKKENLLQLWHNFVAVVFLAGHCPACWEECPPELRRLCREVCESEGYPHYNKCKQTGKP